VPYSSSVVGGGNPGQASEEQLSDGSTLVVPGYAISAREMQAKIEQWPLGGSVREMASLQGANKRSLTH
jgi:hypothetical protein